MRAWAWAMLLVGCGPQTGLMVAVTAPPGESLQQGVTSLDFHVASPSFCDRWVEDPAARVTVDVTGRDLANSPYKFLVRPAHVIDLKQPILVLALARGANGQLLGEAGPGPHSFRLHEIPEYGAAITWLSGQAR